MSRIYRVKLSETSRRTIRVEDGVRTHLQILDVLPRPQIAGLLREALKEKGFAEEEGGDLLRVDADGVEVRVDCEAGQVDVRLARDQAVERSTTQEVALDTDWGEAGKERAREQLRRKLDSEIDAEEEKLRSEVTRKLEGKIADLRVELDTITNRVVADALKIRAGQLGQIIEVDDRLEEGSVTIKVKL